MKSSCHPSAENGQWEKMKWFVMRLLPWLFAGAALFASRWQWLRPLDYPWPLAVFLIAYLCALVFVAWRKLPFFEAVEKLAPSALTLFILAFAFLLVEQNAEKIVVSLLFAFVPCLVLELLFLSVHDPARYPVNGLSRLNIAMIPIAAFYLGATLYGLKVFLRIPGWIVPAAFAALGGLLYYATSHPSADANHKRRWLALGGGLGLHVGFLGLLLPIGMMAHGALSALLLVFPLRLRRYAYQPYPTSGHAWTESLLAVLIFIAILATAQWT